MTARQKCLVVAPYWRLPGHLGAVRVERFVRWLSRSGVEVALVCCGKEDGVARLDWGVEIAIRDPLRFYDFPQKGERQPPVMRKDNPLRRTIAYLLLVPDPIALWARRSAGHPLVAEHAAGAKWVLSSSPPESVHLAAERIAQATGAQLIVDLRDGWLDVPIIPMLRSNPLQRWRHARLEHRIVERASHVFVTTGVWQDLLTRRLAGARGKTSVLTNAYPPGTEAAERHSEKDGASGGLTMLYTGRIRSRTTRRERHLLEPLLDALAGAGGRLVFLGAFSEPEVGALEEWRPRFAEIGWAIDIEPPVPREEAMARMRWADGLLLLSTFAPPIPAKFFEYLAAGRPILAVTPAGGAVGGLVAGIRQLFVIDPGDMTSAGTTVKRFLDYCREGADFDLPEEFSEATQMPRFLAAFGLGPVDAE